MRASFPAHQRPRFAAHDRGGIFAVSSDEFITALNGCRQNERRKGATTDELELHRRLIAVFDGEEDPRRRADELLWHLTAVGEWPKLACELSNLSFLAEIWPTHGQLIPTYWDYLESQSHVSRWEVLRPYAQLPLREFAQLKVLYYSVEGYAPDAAVLELTRLLCVAAQRVGREALSDSLLIQANAFIQRDRLDAAEQLLNGVMQLCGNGGGREQASSLTSLGIIAMRRRAFATSAQHLEQARECYEQLGDISGACDARGNSVVLFAEMGD